MLTIEPSTARELTEPTPLIIPIVHNFIHSTVPADFKPTPINQSRLVEYQADGQRFFVMLI